METVSEMTGDIVSWVAAEDNPVSVMWQTLRRDSALWQGRTALGSLLARPVLDAASLELALTSLLARKLADTDVSVHTLTTLFQCLAEQDARLARSCAADLQASVSRDPACESPCEAFFFFKGFHALQAYRLAHRLWNQGDTVSACWLQSRCAALFGVDIHPAARLGNGIFIDHATGIVIGETAVVGDRVSLLHGVTLGGTGKEAGDRHPKVGNDVTISANATVLGNIQIGDRARIGACSVVLRDVPSGSTVVGNPADIVRRGSSRASGTAGHFKSTS